MNSKSTKKMSRLIFLLNPDEDGWPPVGTESIPVEVVGSHKFRITVPPLFVGDLSVGDEVIVTLRDDGYVSHFEHYLKSDRSTLWVMRGKGSKTNVYVKEMRNLGCNSETFEEIGLYAVDVPGDVSMNLVESILREIERDGGSVAEPSFRH